MAEINIFIVNFALYIIMIFIYAERVFNLLKYKRIISAFD